MTFSLHKIISYFTPKPPIGGLEVSESALRFLQIKGGVFKVASLRLPPGIIENGRLKDMPNFVAALKSLRSRIEISKKKPIYVIASLPSEPVFAQAFAVPAVAEANLEEAAQLNLQMISPLKPEDSYSSWQTIGRAGNGGDLYILGAVIERGVSDSYNAALKEGGFMPVAAEFSALSLARLVKDITSASELQQPAIIINVSSDGIEYSIIRNGNLYFNYFVSWRTIAGNERQILFSVFERTVVRNLQQVINFYRSKWGETVKNFLLISAGLQNEIENVVLRNFPGVTVKNIIVTKYATLPPAYFVALGAALRGLIPRSDDIFISLLKVGTKAEYRLSQYRLFFSFWRNIVAASLGFLVVIFILGDLFLANFMQSMSAKLHGIGAAEEIVAMSKLEEEAKEFNRTVKLAKETKAQEVAFAPFLRKIQSLSLKSGVNLTRVATSVQQSVVIISGISDKEEDATAFRKALEEDPQIDKAELPLSAIVKGERGFVFTITVVLKR